MMQEHLDIPEAWQRLDPERLSGTTLVVGATDTGKSTLVSYLADRLCGRGKRVGWIDGDIGQSTLGLPATQNLALVDQPGQHRPSPEATFFVGATSPRGHMLQVLTGMALLQRRAEQLGAQTVVVDTTGFVAVETGGGALKEWLTELLRPAAIVALQQKEEVEHLLVPWRRDRRFTLHVLPVCRAVRPRSREQRGAYRRWLFHRYFRQADPLEFPLDGVAVYGSDKALPGRLLALRNEGGWALALGVLLRRSSERLQVVTPLQDLTNIASLCFGSLRLDPHSGEELSDLSEARLTH